MNQTHPLLRNLKRSEIAHKRVKVCAPLLGIPMIELVTRAIIEYTDAHVTGVDFAALDASIDLTVQSGLGDDI